MVTPTNGGPALDQPLHPRFSGVFFSVKNADSTKLELLIFLNNITYFFKTFGLGEWVGNRELLAGYKLGGFRQLKGGPSDLGFKITIHVVNFQISFH